MKFWHIIPDSNHVVSLAKSLMDLDTQNDHEILIYGLRGHQKSYVEETKALFPKTRDLGGNLTFGANDVVVAHGIFTDTIISFLNDVIQKGIKVAWCVWGGDLHMLAPVRGVTDFLNAFSCVICAPGELQLYPELTLPEVHGCPYAFDKDLGDRPLEKEKLIILGNSGDPSNRHEYLLELAAKFDGYRIHIPFAYNVTPEYRTAVLSKSKELNLGDRITLQEKILPLEEYSNLLGKAEFLLAAHNRQQAVGSISIAYQRNCRVYMTKEIRTKSGLTMVNPGYLQLLSYGYVDIQDVFDLESDANVQSIITHPPPSNRLSEVSATSVENRLATYERVKRVCGVK
ncbi:TDP-N-acetylfucosamine:lipid II N-acetylfucosaminyltransferase [Epibacterium sp. DP7N7-1]|nr:TDP-N-acetylfucosamine:lipid II N-acetylfucosaminyltransferase [Epibacterium sp. DP7N7-1]